MCRSGHRILFAELGRKAEPSVLFLPPVKEGLVGLPVAAQLKNWLSRHVKSSENFRMSVSEHGPPNKQPAGYGQLKKLPLLTAT